jgi:hypothetical protein
VDYGFDNGAKLTAPGTKDPKLCFVLKEGSHEFSFMQAVDRKATEHISRISNVLWKKTIDFAGAKEKMFPVVKEPACAGHNFTCKASLKLHPGGAKVDEIVEERAARMIESKGMPITDADRDAIRARLLDSYTNFYEPRAGADLENLTPQDLVLIQDDEENGIAAQDVALSRLTKFCRCIGTVDVWGVWASKIAAGVSIKFKNLVVLPADSGPGMASTTGVPAMNLGKRAREDATEEAQLDMHAMKDED